MTQLHRRLASLLALVTVLVLALAGAVSAYDGIDAPIRKLDQWLSNDPAYLPMVMLRTDASQLPIPKTAAPPTLTPTPEPTATPTEVVCPPLEERLQVTDVNVVPYEVRVKRSSRDGTQPIFLAPAAEPLGAVVAWSDGQGTIHLTPLNTDDHRYGPDIEIPGDEVRGLVVHDEDRAVLVVRADNLHLVRVDAGGEVVFDTHLVGGGSQTVAGNKWVDNWGHEARLVWDGEMYGVYSGHTQQFGAQGKHQGDLLWFFDEDGERVDTKIDWDWGCSHSLDLRLAHNGTRFGPVCLSDAYPSKAFHFNHRSKVRDEPSGNERGFSAANLGGWVPTDDGFVMSFSSPEGRSSSDVGLIQVSNDAEASAASWLTDTPDIDESAPHLARYGSDLLAGWTSDGRHLLAWVDADGFYAQGPVPVAPTIADKDDMVSFPDGDVVWAYAWDDLSLIRVVRVDWCEVP